MDHTRKTITESTQRWKSRVTLVDHTRGSHTCLLKISYVIYKFLKVYFDSKAISESFEARLCEQLDVNRERNSSGWRTTYDCLCQDARWANCLLRCVYNEIEKVLSQAGEPPQQHLAHWKDSWCRIKRASPERRGWGRVQPRWPASSR